MARVVLDLNMLLVIHSSTLWKNGVAVTFLPGMLLLWNWCVQFIHALVMTLVICVHLSGWSSETRAGDAVMPWW